MNYDLIDLENFGKAASRAYLENKIPLNDSISKLAEAKNLNSEQVKLVVEEANNSTHLTLLPTAEEKYIEFAVADYNKVAAVVFENEPLADKLADYRLSPNAKAEVFIDENDQTTLLTSKHDRYADPNDMSESEALKFAEAYNGKMKQYENALGEHQAEFGKFVDDYYKEIKQAVLGGEKLAHIRQAAIMTKEDTTHIEALDSFFAQVQGRLKEAGVSVYPLTADISLDTDKIQMGVPNEDHGLTKLSSDFCERVSSYKDALDKKAGVSGAAMLFAVGATTGVAGTGAVMQFIKNQKDLKRAIGPSNPLLRRNRPQDMGFNAATRRY